LSSQCNLVCSDPNLHDSALVQLCANRQTMGSATRSSEMVVAQQSSEILTAMSGDAIGRRRVTAVENGAERAAYCTSEFSLPSVVEFSGILRQC